jgi:hypothetical protein
LQFPLPLRFVLVRANAILRRRDRVVRHAVLVDAFALVRDVLLVGRTVAFDRALVRRRVVCLFLFIVISGSFAKG